MSVNEELAFMAREKAKRFALAVLEERDEGAKAKLARLTDTWISIAEKNEMLSRPDRFGAR